MKLFNNLSLRFKLALIIVSVSAVSLVAASLMLLAMDLTSFRDRLVQENATLSLMIARNCVAPVSYNDETGAWNALEPLAERGDAAWAVVRQADGGVVAAYQRGYPSNRKEQAVAFQGNGIIIENEIVDRGTVIGHVVIGFDYSQYRARVVSGCTMVLCALLLSLILSGFLAVRMRSVLITPLLALEKTARKVAEEGKYSARVPVAGNDEIGSLTRAFNRMLEEIQTRDEALAEAAGHLEQQVHQLEKEIGERARAEAALRDSEDLLRQSQKMEAIGQLAGGVAHDFNNLMTAVNGYGMLALKKLENNPEATSYIMEIVKAGERAAALTRQLLAYSRKQVFKTERLNLNDVVRNLDGLLSRLIGENYRLELNLNENIGSIEADTGQLEQILVNLVVNARDAMEEDGGGVITITTRKTDAFTLRLLKGFHYGNDEIIEVSVSDTGCGMDDETRKKIFEPFFTTKEVGRGTGLGLATVQGIVVQSQGHISVESRPGAGTTFRIYLRGLPAVVAAPPPPLPGPPNSTEGSRAA